jgi:hypothetical protein
VAKVATKMTDATDRGSPSTATSGARSKRLESAKRTEMVGKDGRTNRCR